MSYLPKLYNSLATARENISFNGLSKLPEISAGELKAAVNMDNSILPALRARGGRYMEQELELQPGDSQDTVCTWHNIFSADGIFVRTYLKMSPGILPRVDIQYTFPGDFVPEGQPLEQNEAGIDPYVSAFLSVQRMGSSLICLPSPGRKLYSKTYALGSDGQYAFTTLSTPEWENAAETYNDMCLYNGRVFLAGQNGDKASIRIFAENFPHSFNHFQNGDGSFKLNGAYAETLQYGPLTVCRPYNGGVVLFSAKDMLFTQCMDAGTYKTTKIAGIGCPLKNTAVICQNVLYWLSPDGVYAYTGGIPQRISDKLPDISNAQKACAGTDGLRYYLDVQDGGGHGVLYVYCPQNGTWIQEDEQSFNSFAFHDGRLYAVNDGQLLSFNDGRSTEEVPWSFEAAVSSEGKAEHKQLLSVILDMEGKGKYPVSVSLKPQDGKIVQLGSFYIGNRAVYNLPASCSHPIQSLVIEGRGQAQIYSLDLEYEI